MYEKTLHYNNSVVSLQLAERKIHSKSSNQKEVSMPVTIENIGQSVKLLLMPDSS